MSSPYCIADTVEGRSTGFSVAFPDELVADLTAAFTEQEVVVLAALAADRNARLFEALGAPPLHPGRAD